MTSVINAFRIGERYLTDGDLGIEIEVEGDNLPRCNKYWRHERDGSLRGESMEYVLEKPLSLPDVGKAIKHLDQRYKENNTNVHESVRAGVHVHVNVQKLDVVGLYNFITSYIILEEMLIKYCGEYREGNLFCLRVKDADYLLYMLEKVAGNKNYKNLHTDILRYASMNVKALGQYGSLEFRAMRGTRNLSLIHDWAAMLLGLREVSQQFETPSDIVDYFNAVGSEEFCDRFLGQYMHYFEQYDKDALLTEGVALVTPLAKHTKWTTHDSVNIGGLDFPVGTQFPNEPQQDF